MPKGWRLWLLIALLIFFPIAFHRWWLLILSAAIFLFLMWVLHPGKWESKSPVPAGPSFPFPLQQY